MRISDWSSDVCSSDLAERVELVGHRGDAPVEALLHLSTLRLDVHEHGLGRGQRQRMADERAGKIGHANGWPRIAASMPMTADETTNHFRLARDYANRVADTPEQRVGTRTRLSTEQAQRGEHAPDVTQTHN